MNPQLQQIGGVLAAHVDMAKGFLGDQFAVSIIARHKTGPFHLLLGDDAELPLINCLSELQRIGKHLVRVGEDGSVVEIEPGDADAPTEWDHMVNMVREMSEWFQNKAAAEFDTLSTMGTGDKRDEQEQWVAELEDLCNRGFTVLDMVTPDTSDIPEADAAWFDKAKLREPAKLKPRCLKPPEGWRCTRGEGHDGPCAAVRTGTPHGDQL